MKVKEIVEILNDNLKNVTVERIVEQLDNIGISADAETDVPTDIVKKFGKLYKCDIKPKKAKKPSKEAEEVIKPEVSEKAVEAKKPAKNEEIKVPQEQKNENKGNNGPKEAKKENKVNQVNNITKKDNKNNNQNNNKQNTKKFDVSNIKEKDILHH